MIEQEYLDRICKNCYVAILYPMSNPKLTYEGWHQCEFCGYCCQINKEHYERRTSNQH